jgi:hypothetical protein
MNKIALIFIPVALFVAGIFMYHYFSAVHQATADDSELFLAQVEKGVQKKNNTWVVKIDNRVITLNEFEREFDVHVYSLPFDEAQKSKYEGDVVNKRKFLTNLINEFLIYNRALNEGYEKRQDVQDLLKAVQRRAIIQVYLNEKIEPKLQDIPDEQIEAIYNQNKKMYAGVDIDVARQQIRMLLLQRQYNEYLNELVDELKGEAKVIRNEDVDL